ncbi:hypothetical protein Nepgr_011547 [Nepenthes gracilis]|uniref:Protein DA1-like domain-containing protein n=1 Tax=Nepenthes gracilis TaxID=150966 RepID=A0AAD3XMH4_NEPGR|nr:hypothetical protein Nepgr_011547 [Nepenthes gracilis]
MEKNLRCLECQYVTNVYMDWLSKTFKGSTNSFLAREYHGAYGENTYWDYGQPTLVDLWADDNNDGIDRAIAVSVLEEDQKGKRFYEGLNMNIIQQIPLLLVERPALNEVMDGENKSPHQLPETRGLCLSEEQTVSTILRRPRIGIESNGSVAYGNGFRRGTEAARQLVVPLQIKAGAVLLFAAAITSMVVIGPNAHVTKTMNCNYKVTPCKPTTPLQGLSTWRSTTYQRDCMNVTCTITQITGPYGLIRQCEVIAILLLFGLLRLLIESSLAHEMMHAWRHLNGYPNLNLEVEEGICQVLAHSWLDYEVIANSGSSCETNSSSSLSTSLPALSLVSLTSSGSSKKEEEPKQQDRELSLSKSKLVLYSYLLLLSRRWWSLALMLMSPKL